MLGTGMSLPARASMMRTPDVISTPRLGFCLSHSSRAGYRSNEYVTVESPLAGQAALIQTASSSVVVAIRCPRESRY